MNASEAMRDSVSFPKTLQNMVCKAKNETPTFRLEGDFSTSFYVFANSMQKFNNFSFLSFSFTNVNALLAYDISLVIQDREAFASLKCCHSLSQQLDIVALGTPSNETLLFLFCPILPINMSKLVQLFV